MRCNAGRWGCEAFLTAVSMWHWWVACVWYSCVWCMERGPWKARGQRSSGRPVHEDFLSPAGRGCPTGRFTFCSIRKGNHWMNFNRAKSWSDEGYKTFQKRAMWKMNHRVGRQGKGPESKQGVLDLSPLPWGDSCGEVKKMRGKEAVNSGLGI